MNERPADECVSAPWVIQDCECKGTLDGCDICDGYGWYYENSQTEDRVSEMMRDAMERHG